MKITCSKRDDVLRRKAEYEADKAERTKRYNEQNAQFNKARLVSEDKIISFVSQAVSSCGLDLNITASMGWGSRWTVRIDDTDDKFNENKALAWDYRVELDNDGNVKKQTSSWSGMNGTTEANIEYLKKIVKCLEILNSLDWETLFNETPYPDYDDYVTEDDPRYDRNVEDFDAQLLEIDIEEIVGTNRGVKRNDSKYFTCDVYTFIVKDSGSQYTVFDIPTYSLDRLDESTVDRFKSYTYRVAKKKFFDTLVKPIEYYDLEVAE